MLRPGRAEQLACLRPGGRRGFPQPSPPHQVSITLQQPQSPRAAPGQAHSLLQPPVPSPGTLLGQGATGGTDRQTDRCLLASPSGTGPWMLQVALGRPQPQSPRRSHPAVCTLHLRTQEGCAGAGGPLSGCGVCVQHARAPTQPSTQHGSPAPSPRRAGAGAGGTEPRVPGRMPESSEVKRREQNQNQAMGAQASESESEEERDRDPNKQQNPRGRGGVREREVPGMW